MSHSPKSVPLTTAPSRISRQLSLALNSIQLPSMTPMERTKAIASLAFLLMQAAGVSMGERTDDKR